MPLALIIITLIGAVTFLIAIGMWVAGLVLGVVGVIVVFIIAYNDF